MSRMKPADQIILQSDLAEGKISKQRKLAHASKSVRQNIIRKNKNSEDGQISAAIEIQRRWRGFNTRSNLFSVVNPKASKTAVYSGSQHIITRLDDFEAEDYYDEEEQISTKPPGRVKLDKFYETYRERMRSIGQTEIAGFEDFCANYIQDWWHRHSFSEKGRSDSLTEERVVKKPAKVRTEPLNEMVAATIIQRGWRRHIDMQVYKYYKDLINFKNRGDPSLMLRCINPNEAKLLDSAAGIHVRFRLAGERFPPNIYYKIFTHRSVVDMCANSPKDYTKPSAKLKMGSGIHNITNVGISDDRRGWYKRSDNNGWRLVSDRLIHHIMSDPITWETSNKKYEFHHDKLQRKQDVEKRRKQKKIHWMQKMYKEGMLKAKAEDSETVKLIEGAAAGMVATVESSGPDALEDWEVDELLDWTTSLNFEDYLQGWKELATSANSEKNIDDKIHLATNSLDPYEFTVSAHSRYQTSSAPSQNSRHTLPSSLSARIAV